MPSAPSEKYISSTFRLTHVCRSWRNAVIACPQLWSFIDTEAMSPELFDIFSNRSHTAPITVTLADHHLRSATEHLHQAILPRHRETLRRCRYNAWYQMTPDLFKDFFNATITPSLESLSVLAAVNHEGSQIDHFNHGLPLSPFPSLLALSLSPFPGLPPCAFPNLTHLLLSFSTSYPWREPSYLCQLLSENHSHCCANPEAHH